MAQILQPLHNAVGNLSDSINSFFGLGENAPRVQQPASSLPAHVIEVDPHYFSSSRWMQEIEW
jgi:hypothetical protein